MNDIWWEIARMVVPGSLGACFGAAIALFAEPLKQWLYTPKVTLHFFPAETSPYPSCDESGTPNVDEMTGQHKWTKNVRIRVTNQTTRRTAKTCRAYLHRIERLDPVAGRFELIHGENLQLPWAFSDHKPQDIPGGTSLYCSVFYLLSGSNESFLQAHAPNYSWKSATSQVGTYRFTIMVVGDNFPPRTLTVSFNWQRSYDSVSQADFEVVNERRI